MERKEILVSPVHSAALTVSSALAIVTSASSISFIFYFVFTSFAGTGSATHSMGVRGKSHAAPLPPEVWNRLAVRRGFPGLGHCDLLSAAWGL